MSSNHIYRTSPNVDIQFLDERRFSLSDRTPYTYLIRFVDLGFSYYGVRYAKRCHPQDLGKEYFSSSKSVNTLLQSPNVGTVVFEVRRIFHNKRDAILWEQRVIRRILRTSRSLLNVRASVHAANAVQTNSSTKTICNKNTQVELCVPVDFDISQLGGFELGRLKAPFAKGTMVSIFNRELGISKLVPKDDSLPEGWEYGSGYVRAFNVETQTYKSVKIGSPIPEGYSTNLPKRFRTEKRTCFHDGTNIIQLKPEDPIPEGFVKGIPCSGNKGSIHAYNPETLEVVIVKKLENVPQGWELGNPTLGKNMLGTKLYHDPNNEQHIRFLKEDEIPEGWVMGTGKRSWNANKRMSIENGIITYVSEEDYKETGETLSWYTDGTKDIMSSTQPKGFWRGRSDTGNTEESKMKAKKTSLDRYGVEYAMRSKEVQERVKATRLERYGNYHTPERRQQTSEMLKERNSVNYVCPHCGKEGKGPSMKRYHMDNCKFKKD